MYRDTIPDKLKKNKLYVIQFYVIDTVGTIHMCINSPGINLALN